MNKYVSGPLLGVGVLISRALPTTAVAMMVTFFAAVQPAIAQFQSTDSNVAKWSESLLSELSGLLLFKLSEHMPPTSETHLTTLPFEHNIFECHADVSRAISRGSNHQYPWLLAQFAPNQPIVPLLHRYHFLSC